MDYSKCNFVSVLQFSPSLAKKAVMRVNVKSGNATLTMKVNEGFPFVLMGIDEAEKVIRVQMSEAEGTRISYEAKTGIFYLPKAVHQLIIDGFDSAKSKVINLEKGNDGAWYGKY